MPESNRPLADGTLSGKMPFCSDGMVLDSQGNVYLTTRMVAVYNKEGKKIEEIAIPERPANVTFGGPGRKTLLITTRTSLSSVLMQVTGADTPVRH